MSGQAETHLPVSFLSRGSAERGSQAVHVLLVTRHVMQSEGHPTCLVHSHSPPLHPAGVAQPLLQTHLPS